MKVRNLSMLLPVLFLAATFWTSANAQATRTWISGEGDDVKPCSRTEPCKTFAGAISKTANGGEINCLDPAGFGSVTITKSITLDCTGTLGSILAAGTNGIVVNGDGISVRIRGLALNGASTGLVGLRVVKGASVAVENTVFDGFVTGISVEGAANVLLSDVSVRNNGSGITAAAGTVYLFESRVYSNKVGLTKGGKFVSYKNNMIAGNESDGGPVTGVTSN